MFSSTNQGRLLQNKWITCNTLSQKESIVCQSRCNREHSSSPTQRLRAPRNPEIKTDFVTYSLSHHSGCQWPKTTTHNELAAATPSKRVKFSDTTNYLNWVMIDLAHPWWDSYCDWQIHEVARSHTNQGFNPRDSNRIYLLDWTSRFQFPIGISAIC